MTKVSEFQNIKFSRWNMDLRETRLKKVSDIILSLPSGKLLDIGCNAGEFSSQFISKGWNVYGIDISASKIRKAIKRGIKAKVENIDGKKLPYKRESFDLVFIGELLEHVFDTTKLLKEIYRILKKDGKVILTTPNTASLENRFRLMIGMQPIWVDYKMEYSSGHIRSYTFSSINEQLNGVGFRIDNFIGNFVSIWQFRWNDINYPILGKLGYIFPHISQDMIILASKKN